jgi:hypothetical protein
MERQSGPCPRGRIRSNEPGERERERKKESLAFIFCEDRKPE